MEVGIVYGAGDSLPLASEESRDRADRGRQRFVKARSFVEGALVIGAPPCRLLRAITAFSMCSDGLRRRFCYWIARNSCESIEANDTEIWITGSFVVEPQQTVGHVAQGPSRTLGDSSVGPK